MSTRRPGQLPQAAAPDAAELRSRFGDDLLADVPGALAGSGLVAAPRTPEQLAELLGLASERGWSVAAAGAGTWPQRPHPPTGLVVTTSRLTGVFEHEPEDLVVGVRAGTTHTALQEALRPAKQFLPLDPAAGPEATIGATVALRCAGPLRAGYGTPRDLVLGLEMVTGDGRLLRFGGRVVKNVAGYDGVRLMTGSRGRLGIITAVFIRLRSLPRMDRTAAVRATSAEEAAGLALALRDACAGEALEVVSPGAAGMLELAPEWHVIARLHGSRDGVEERLERLRRIAGSPAAADQPPLAPLWARLGAVEAAARPAFELSLPPSGLGGALAVLDASLPRWALAAHATDGVIRGWPLSADAGMPAPGQLRNIAANASGNARWLVPPDPGADAPEPDTGAAADTVRLLSDRLAAAFDPAGILAGAAGW